jgi:hypothetical protein
MDQWANGCTQMGVIATFSWPTFIQLFPEFSYLNSAQGVLYFNLATAVHRNDGGGPITDATQQLNLLNIATAHVIKLLAQRQDGEQSPDLVGRITNASEGSVSVAAEMPMPANANAAWWNQTKYGAMYWLATAPYRTMRYRPGFPRPTDPWPIYGNFFGSGNWWGPQ